MIVPVILGSDKTTTSVATGDNEYYPLYISIGNVHNNVRRAHRDAVEVVGFLSVAKSTYIKLDWAVAANLMYFVQPPGSVKMMLDTGGFAVNFCNPV